MIVELTRLRRVAGWALVGAWTLMQAIAAEPASAPGAPPPLPPSPIQQFREWLSMTPQDREKAVSEWPPEKRKVLLQKLRAYEALPSAERDRRLNVLELRFYLRPLMDMKLEERQGALNVIPVTLRALVEERLKNWDSLTPAVRQEILANDNARELVTKYYLQLQQGRSKEEILTALHPQKRAEIDQALQTWNSLPAAARNRTAAQLTAFFELPRVVQDRAFQELSESERQDIQKTLDTFARLSPEQRRLCVESFWKFTMMPPPERASFLRNAARWQAMSPEDRALWKQLVTKLPPLPPARISEPPKPDGSAVRSRMAETNPAK
jgi:hypothetical protein